MAYESLTGPIGGFRLDRAAALIAQTVYAGAAGKAPALREFLPKWADEGEDE